MPRRALVAGTARAASAAVVAFLAGGGAAFVNDAPVDFSGGLDMA